MYYICISKNKMYNIMEETHNELFVRLLINQIETDIDENDFESIDEMLTSLVQIPETQKILLNYLNEEDIEKLNKHF